MKIKVKNLTETQIQKICDQYPVECNSNCPLYRLKEDQPRLCKTWDEKLLETEIEIDKSIFKEEDNESNKNR